MELSEIFRNKTIDETNNIRKYLKTIWENCRHIFQSATKASKTLTFVPPCFSGFYMDVSTVHFVDTQTLTMSEKQGSESKGLEEWV